MHDETTYNQIARFRYDYINKELKVETRMFLKNHPTPP
jgi:hypothetical protein